MPVVFEVTAAGAVIMAVPVAVPSVPKNNFGVQFTVPEEAVVMQITTMVSTTNPLE